MDAILKNQLGRPVMLASDVISLKSLPLSKDLSAISTMKRKERRSFNITKRSSKRRCVGIGNLQEDASSETHVPSLMGSMNYSKRKICLLISKHDHVSCFTEHLIALMEAAVNLVMCNLTFISQRGLTILKSCLRMCGFQLNVFSD